MPIKGSNTRVRSHSYLYAFCLLLGLPLGYIGGIEYVITCLR